jgi:hypothetical protein
MFVSQSRSPDLKPQYFPQNYLYKCGTTLGLQKESYIVEEFTELVMD